MHTRRTRRGAVAAAVALLAVAAGVPARAATPTVAEAVTAALTGRPGSGLVADDSTATQCMASAASPLAYRGDRIVLRTTLGNGAAATEVRRALASLGASGTVTAVERITFPPPPTPEPVVEPVLSVTIVPETSAGVPLVALARRLRGGRVTSASLDYALSPSGGPVGMWPDGFPEPTTEQPPTRPAGTGSPAGAGVTALVYDVGLARPAEGNLPPNVSRLAGIDAEEIDRDADGLADLYYAGHGVAIASVIDSLAPGATVEVARIVDGNGIATDVSAARRMATSLTNLNNAGTWPDLIVAAFGSPVCDLSPTAAGGELLPLGLQAVTEAVERHHQALIVAASGNRSTSRRFYPAAFPSVLSVGALDTTADADANAWTAASRSGPKADFSNYGRWVRAWAPGASLVTRHLVGFRFERAPEGALLDGLAVVRGTSYATPYVAALVAEQMARTGQSPSAAWRAIARSGVRCSAAIGGGTAVALTALANTATSPPTAPVAC